MSLATSKLTIKHVAREAGVSPMTVSRTLHQPEQVAPITRAKVLEVCERLNYRPNASARNLRTKISHQVGVIIPDLRNAFWIDVVSGIEEVMTASGFDLLIGNSNEQLQRLTSQTNTMLSRLVDGLLIAPTVGSTRLIQNLQREGKNIVLIDRLPSGLNGIDYVGIDNEAGAYKATMHLIEAGHERIGLLAGNVNLNTGGQRLAGYRRALSEQGLPERHQWIRTAKTDVALVGKQVGYEGTLEFIDMADRPTALLCTSNTIMIGALMALQEQKVQIPADMALVSFGNKEWTALLTPPLTVITQSTFEVGRQAARILIDHITRNPTELAPKHIVLDPQLIIRGSSV
jgi:LacI family transcriptional regulator